MEIRQYDIWLADLSPKRGTEPGKIRPVVIIQTDLLNPIHPSTLVCPLTSRVNRSIQLLRVHVGKSQLDKPSDILIDQVRAIDNLRFLKKIGRLSRQQITLLRQNLMIVMDLN